MALEGKLFKWQWGLGTIAVDLKITREISVFYLAITKIRGLNVNTAKQDERRKSQDRRMAEDRRMRPKLWSQAAAFRDGSGLSKRTKPERRQNDVRRQPEQETKTMSVVNQSKKK